MRSLPTLFANNAQLLCWNLGTFTKLFRHTQFTGFCRDVLYDSSILRATIWWKWGP